MNISSKLKNSKSYKPSDCKSNWAIALGDLVKKTKKNLEGIDSPTLINEANDGSCCSKDDRLFQKTSVYKMMGTGRSSSSIASRNSTCRFATNKNNSNSIESHDCSSYPIAASFEDNQNLNVNFKNNCFLPPKSIAPKAPETYGMKHQPLTTAFMSQTHQFDKRSVIQEFSQELSILK